MQFVAIHFLKIIHFFFKLLSRAIKIIGQHFDVMMLEEQDCLGSEAQVKQFLRMVPDEQLRNKLETEMLRFSKSVDRWRVFEELGINTNKVFYKNAFVHISINFSSHG